MFDVAFGRARASIKTILNLLKGANNGQLAVKVSAEDANIQVKLIDGRQQTLEIQQDNQELRSQLDKYRKRREEEEAVESKRREELNDKLIDASSEGYFDTVMELLTKGADANAKGKYDNTPLGVAAANGRKDVVELLLANKAKVNARHNNWTPLHAAAMNGRKDVAELLLAKGAEANAKSVNGSTPLHDAAQGGHIDVVRLLLSVGANVNAQCQVEGWESGYTPLHTAVEKMAAPDNAYTVVELLLAQNADVNAKNLSSGRTPLHCAAFDGLTKLAELLLAKGADVNAEDKYGITPLLLAALNGHKDVAAVLDREGGILRCGKVREVAVEDLSRRTPLHLVAEGRRKDDSGWLINDGADINAEDFEGDTPLHLAARNDDIRPGQPWRVMERLLAVGAEVNAKNNHGLTPLHIAVQCANPHMAELLLAHGADVNAKDHRGSTPLQIATISRYKEIVELLGRHGGHE